MGGTRFTSKQSSPILSNSPESIPEPPSVNPQKNNFYSRYPRNVSSYESSFRQQHYAAGSTEKNGSNFFLIKKHQNCIRVHDKVPASQKQMQPGSLPMPLLHNGGSSLNGQTGSSSEPNLNFAAVNNPFGYGKTYNQPFYHTDQNEMYSHPSHTSLPTDRPFLLHAVHTPWIYPTSHYNLGCNTSTRAPFMMIPRGGFNTGYNSRENMFSFDHACEVHNSQSNAFQLVHIGESCCHVVPSSVTYQQTLYKHNQDNSGQGKQSWVTQQQPLGPGLFRSDVLLPTTPKSLTDYKTRHIQEIAQSFVESCLPLLTKKPYCVPPVKRSQHPDRGSKRLVQGMESEKRVLGSFERFFAEQQLPVFMLCHYPMSGFMQVYNGRRDYPDRDSEILNGKSDRNTVTILLLSHLFAVTVVTINTGSGSSDFPYLQRSVHKTAMRGKRCCTTVTQWLTFLGVTPKVRQVIAFPNVKKAIVHRITNEKSFQLEFGSLCTLHVDELSPPFEEEWSTPEQKHIFSEWMKKQITCHSPTLSGEDVHLVVGALLSPRLSYVDFVDESTIIAPISESMKYSDEVEKTVQDVKHLKLTISGVTKPFDEFMDEYVSCYYPKLEEQTYRVPPIHFNIQSFKKPREYIQNMKGNSPPTKSSSDLREVNCGTASESMLGFLKEGVDNESENNIQRGEPSNIRNQFMPPYRSYHMSAKRSSNCSDNTGPLEHQTLKSGSSQATVPQAVVSSLDTTHSENSQRRNRSSGKSHDSQSTQYNSHHQHTAVPAEFNSKSRFIGSEASAQSTPTVSKLQSQSLPSASVKGGKMSTEIPPEMRSSKNICLEALQDVEVLCEVMAKDTRADEGENRVICALESLGEKFGPMFIICGYQYNNYLNKLKEEMFSKGDASRPVRAFGQTMRAEHDCLIFHKKYGAIIVCIKAIGDNFTEWGASEEQKINSTNRILEKAVKQLEREETMLKHVTSDLDPKLACHKLIALPNMTRERVEKALEAEDRLLQKVKSVLGHGSELFLCSDELPSKYEAVWDHQDQSLKEKLISWWEKVDKFFSSNEEGLTSRIYRQVIGRYCGLLSTVEVWSTASPRIEVRSASEAVNACFERFRKFVLLPHQVQALCLDDRRMFLYGPPGSGKTLVLILKAKEWLLAGETVILINSRPGSVYGFPYAYGVYKRLQRMMHEWNIQLVKLVMLTVDCLRFKADDLAGVMPSSCIIMDEVTPASHKVIEHLCSLQVSNIWCAGLFEDDRPITAHSFTAFKMHKILRCPPVVQSVLKHTESQVRMATPYKEDYQVSMFEKKHLNIKRYGSSPSDGGLCSDKEIKKELMKQDFSSRKSPLEDNSSKCSSGKSPLEDNSSKCSSGNPEIKKLCMMEVNGNENIHKENEISQEVLKYDPESLNKRLQERYNNQENENEKSQTEGVGDSGFIYSTSSSEIGLPTDGPRPHIIDHSRHSQAGSPNDCSECGSSLAEFLKSMVRSEDVPASSGRSRQQDQSKSASKNSVSTSGRGRSGKTAESVLFSITSSVHTKSSPFISRQKPSSLTDGKALSWSDVLIVGREFPKDSAFIAALRSRHIPVEVLMGGRTSEIEDAEDNKLFITSYKEVTGLERALIVFVPSDSPNLQDSANTVNINDLQLGHCVNHFIEEDKRALWYVASRSLASLVLILS